MSRWTPVVITWDDAHGGDNGWHPASDLHHKPERVTSVGFLHKSDTKGVTIVMSRVGRSVGGYLFVPRCNIVSIEELK